MNPAKRKHVKTGRPKGRPRGYVPSWKDPIEFRGTFPKVRIPLTREDVLAYANPDEILYSPPP